MPPIQSIPTTPEASSTKEKDLDLPGGRQHLQDSGASGREVRRFHSSGSLLKLSYLLFFPLPTLVPGPVHLCEIEIRMASRETQGCHFTSPRSIPDLHSWPRSLGWGRYLRETGTKRLSVLQLVVTGISLVFMSQDLPDFLVTSCLMPMSWRGRGQPCPQALFCTSVKAGVLEGPF